MPLFAYGLFLLEGLQPLTTSSPGEVAAGAMMPPGHIQKEKTPLSSTCCTQLYEAGGMKGTRVARCDCAMSIMAWGCSTLTPRAKGLDSISTPLLCSRVKISRAE